MNKDYLEFNFQASEPDFPGVNNSSLNFRMMRNLCISYALVNIEKEVMKVKTLDHVDQL